jgi:peptidoglycan lytic transglycosylase
MNLLHSRTFLAAFTASALIIAPLSSTFAGACDTKQDLPRDTMTASWYGKEHHGRRTSSGEVFDEKKLTAAHSSLPLNTVVEVTNLANGKKVQVKVNDRGMPNSGEIDLSLAAAKAIGMVECGLALVVLSVVPNPAKGK